MDDYRYPDPLTLAQAYFPSWMQARAREILVSDSKQAAIEYLARESVQLSPGGYNRVVASQTKPGRKVEVYAMTEEKISWIPLHADDQSGTKFSLDADSSFLLKAYIPAPMGVKT